MDKNEDIFNFTNGKVKRQRESSDNLIVPMNGRENGIEIYESNNKPRDYDEDLRNSNDPDLRKDWERIFKLKFGEDCKIKWKDDKNIQLGLGTDTTITTKKGRRYSIELKTRKYSCYNDPNWIMEIVHHLYNNEEKETHLGTKEGWIYYTTAEFIFHGTLNEDGTKVTEVIFYSLIPFKTEKYKGEFEQYKNLWLPTLFSNGNFQLTLNKLIPKEIIKRDTLEFLEWKDENR